MIGWYGKLFLEKLRKLCGMVGTQRADFKVFCRAAAYLNIVLLQLAQKRQERILKATPDALDLMVICVEAGLGLHMAMKKVGDEIRFLCRDLSEEFHLTNLEINADKRREESLKSLGERTGVAEVQILMALLIQTNRFGTSLGQILRVHSDSMRAERRQKAEERAAKAAVKLLIP